MRPPPTDEREYHARRRLARAIEKLTLVMQAKLIDEAGEQRTAQLLEHATIIDQQIIDPILDRKEMHDERPTGTHQ